MTTKVTKREDPFGVWPVVEPNVPVIDAPRVHYVYGAGMHGCLYDYCGASPNYRAAVDALAENFNLGRSRKAKLRRDKYLELKNTGEFADGADYCEVTECRCSAPWVHGEDSKPEDWPDYKGRS